MTMYEGIRLTTLDHGPGHWPGTAMPGETATSSSAGTAPASTRCSATSTSSCAGDEIIFSDARRRARVPRQPGRDRRPRRGVDHRPDRDAARPRCSPATRPARPGSASSCSPTSKSDRTADRCHERSDRYRRASRRRRAGCVALAASLGGVLVAFSLPPWGCWPLAFVGVVVFDARPGRGARRAARPRCAGSPSASPGWRSAWAGCGTSPCPATSSPAFAVRRLPRRRRGRRARPAGGG